MNYTVTNPSGANVPQVTLDSTSLTYEALYVDGSVTPVTPDPSALTFSNFAVTPYVSLGAPTSGGISAMSFTMSDATHGGITFTFEAATSLAQQTYSTPVNVSVCLDPSCVNPVPDANFLLTVQYVVGNSVTVTGPNGYTMSIYPVPAVNISGNANQKLIFASLASTAINNANSVVTVDPTTGLSPFSPLASPAPPNTLALSDDGQYLYVAIGTSVEQVQTSTFMIAQTITQSIAPTSPIQTIAVEPGKPQTIAVGGEFLQIFDGTVARPNSILPPTDPFEGFSVANLQWIGSPPVLYGLVSTGHFAPNECIFPIDALGVTASQSCSTFPMTFGTNGLGYWEGSGGPSEEGIVWNPATWTMVQTWQLPNTFLSSLLPDVGLNKLFGYVTPDSSNFGCWIQSFSLDSLVAISSVPLPRLFTGSPNPNGECNYANSPIIRFGANGIAIMTGVSGGTGYIIVISGAFVGP